MRIGIDFRIADGKPCGMARYTTNLVKALARRDTQNQYILFTHFPSGRQHLGLGENFQWVRLPIRLFSVMEQVMLPRILKQNNLDLFHSLSFSMPLLRHCPSVLTIYDLIHLIHPQEDSAKVAFYYKTIVSWSVRNSDGVVTISENSKRDIQKALGVPEEKITVIYGASDEIFAPMDKGQARNGAAALGIKDPFILYVGNMRAHKNIATLVDAFALVSGSHPRLRLVLCGEKNYSYPALVNKIRDQKLSDKVVFLEGISDTELRSLYCAAEALVLPSFYEGFGLPPLEAMSCGTPVVVANTPALREVAGDGAVSFEPSDAAQLARILEDILTVESVRQDLIGRSVRRARSFSWDIAAAKTLELYGRLAERTLDARHVVGISGGIPSCEMPSTTDNALEKSRQDYLAAFDLDGIRSGEVGILRFHAPHEKPKVSVIIPTLDGDRNGNLSALIKDLCRQRVDSFEVLIVKGTKPQGKAINRGADKSSAPLLVILDDDSRVPNADTFSNLCGVFENGWHIGMAGASVVISPDSNSFQRRAARQFPRFNMPIVDDVTESDMASHGCCAIPRELFYAIGKEKENILRGLDPDLRERIRGAGYKTVLVGRTWVYHPLSPTLSKLLKQFYRNGIGSAHAWIMDPKTVFQTHERADLEGFVPHRSFGYRVLRFPLRLLYAIMTFRVIRCVAYSSYAVGFLHGLAKYSFAKSSHAAKNGTQKDENFLPLSRKAGEGQGEGMSSETPSSRPSPPVGEKEVG